MAFGRMRAARLYGPGMPLRLEDVPLPQPAAGEALVRVRVAGLCHTELHMLDGVLNLGVVPLTPGHEVVGEVIETRGDNGPVPGQRVLLYYYAPCGNCHYCRSGIENLCPNVARQLGFTADGGFAEFLVAPIPSLVAIPDSLSDEAAVGLACGGATALHVARAIAAVQPGEQVVVYGVGGVGLYLVQIAAWLGANVIAIGRTFAKLAAAAELGAQVCINAVSDDPLEAVQAHTGGAGADVVVDLVATAETMAITPRMLARRGRLVFAGYGSDPFTVSPLWLALRELQVRGAVGATLAELRETIDLAAAGRLRSVVDQTYALDDINEALEDLRAGKPLGRALVRVWGTQSESSPDGRGAARRSTGTDTGGEGISSPADRIPGPGSRHAGEGPVAERGTAGDPIFQAAAVGERDVEVGLKHRPSASEDGPSPSVADVINEPRSPLQRRPASEARPAVRASPPPPLPELLAAIARGVDGPLATDDNAFNDLALGLFAYQYARNEPYRRYCDSRRVTPASVDHWRRIPAVPIGAFKETTLATAPVETAVACYMSSGTTRPEQRSRHYHFDLAVYDASAQVNFTAHLLPDGARLPFVTLNPPPDVLPHSSLAHYLGLMLDAYGTVGSGYFVANDGLQLEPLLAALATAERSEQPVCLLGATFAFVHLLDELAERGRRFALAPGSRIMDTGGVKGRSREVERDELANALEERFGVSPRFQVNMYGLTELSTQFLDDTIRRSLAGSRREPPAGGAAGGVLKAVPAWARTRVLHPETLVELPLGEPGVLCHTDLANWASVCTVLTEDQGVGREGGFELLGRLPGSQARGCSIALDELLSAARGRS